MLWRGGGRLGLSHAEAKNWVCQCGINTNLLLYLPGFILKHQ